MQNCLMNCTVYGKLMRNQDVNTKQQLQRRSAVAVSGRRVKKAKDSEKMRELKRPELAGWDDDVEVHELTWQST